MVDSITKLQATCGAIKLQWQCDTGTQPCNWVDDKVG
jgi:hypothetical protein